MKVKYERPFIIGISVGIGNNVTEAQLALKDAKLKKEEVEENEPIRIRLNGPYSISTYKGEVQTETPALLNDLETDLLILRKYEGDPETHSDILKIIEGKKIDPATGTLTPYGYQFELNYIINEEQNKHDKIPQRQILFFDCNDMHHWNDITIYDDVTAHIGEIGKALSSNIHQLESGDRNSDLITRVMEDTPLVHRLHGSAGDEFIVNVRCHPDKLEPLAERLIKACYVAQMNMYNEKQKKTTPSYADLKLP